ncbi:T9SS type A sorting domain-containing protein [candidate division TA06 bacterium]|uniref:T9SS type A sorting domain-containing protein n=1 Tax=candidate division TA06 bacterium TaxID=2250710 RepID=A0A523UY77_UNCT6|nr:MAG: T9SS type A sorting domain-containing protein [candidate division TA06 bacterium]
MLRLRFCLRLSTLMLVVFGLALLSSGLDSARADEVSTSGGPVTQNAVRSNTPKNVQEIIPNIYGVQTETEVNHGRIEPASKADESVRHWRREKTTSQEPIWQKLENLTPAERENALIKLELPTGMSQEVLAQAEKVEDAWNNGAYGHALYLFRELGKLMDIQQVAVGVSWKTPIETPKRQNLWGSDVRIGTRDDIYNEELDFDGGTGHLFAAVLLDDAGTFRWTVNISTDDGASWSESYSWFAGYEINDISATVVGGFFWVSYTGNTDQESARLRRHLVSDGSSDATYGFKTIFDKNSEIRDLDLSANAEATNNRVYYSAILADGSLVLFWDDAGGLSFVEVATGVVDAERGLDSHWNQNFGSLHTWFSWIETDDDVHIAGWSGSNFNDFISELTGPVARFSSIGCWGDTVICVYENLGASTYWIKYLTSPNGGANWYWSYIGDTTAVGSWSPNVTGRMGGGWHVVYEVEIGGEPDTVFHTSNPSYWLPWTSIVPVNDFDVTTGGTVGPRIEWVPGNDYGTIYVASGANYCYFDRSNWVGVAEETRPNLTVPKVFTLNQSVPNPARSQVTVSYALAEESQVALKVYDITGRLVKTLAYGMEKAGYKEVTWDGRDEMGREVSTGTYFYRLTAGDFTAARKMTILR